MNITFSQISRGALAAARILYTPCQKISSLAITILGAAARKILPWRWIASVIAYFHPPVPPARGDAAPLIPDPAALPPPPEEAPILAEIAPPPPAPEDPVPALVATYERILGDLSTQLLSPEADALLRRISEIESAAPKGSRVLDQIATTLTYLRTQQGSLFLPRDFHLDPASNIINVPGDGNCFFHAALIGLELHGIAVVGDSHLTLRRATIAWLREHQEDALVVEQMQESVDAYLQNQRARLRSEVDSLTAMLDFLEGQQRREAGQAIRLAQQALGTVEAGLTHEQYLGMTERPGFFASMAEIYALSQRYDLGISVSHLSDEGVELQRNTFDPRSPGRPTIELVLHRAHYQIRIPVADQARAAALIAPDRAAAAALPDLVERVEAVRAGSPVL